MQAGAALLEKVKDVETIYEQEYCLMLSIYNRL